MNEQYLFNRPRYPEWYTDKSNLVEFTTLRNIQAISRS